MDKVFDKLVDLLGRRENDPGFLKQLDEIHEYHWCNRRAHLCEIIFPQAGCFLLTRQNRCEIVTINQNFRHRLLGGVTIGDTHSDVRRKLRSTPVGWSNNTFHVPPLEVHFSFDKKGKLDGAFMRLLQS